MEKRISCEQLNKLRKSIYTIQWDVQSKLTNMLPRAQYHILFYLTGVGTCTTLKLAEVLGVAPSTVSDILLRMEKNRLISRVRNPSNRRIIEVRLTDTGIETFQMIEQERIKLSEHYLSDLTMEETLSLIDIIEKIEEKAIENQQKG